MKRKKVLFLIITIAFLFSCRCYFWGPLAPKCRPPEKPCENVVYGVKYIGCADSLYRIDLDSLRYEVIAPLSLDLHDRYVGLDFNIDGTLYLIVGSTGDLHKVDTATGVVTFVRNIPLYYGEIMECIAFAPVEVPGPDSSFPAGTLFGAEDSILHAINIETGEVQIIGEGGRGNDAIAFSREGILYGFNAEQSLHTIDTRTAESSEVIANPLGFASLTSSCDGSLYSADCRFLYRHDPGTGDMESLYDLGHKTAGLASVP